MRRPSFRLVLPLLGLCCVPVFWAVSQRSESSNSTLRRKIIQALPNLPWFEPQVYRVRITDPVAAKIVAAAHLQEGDTYNAAYKTIAYPGGDVPGGSGACTDVVIRALRGAGLDLQKLIHEDMVNHIRSYPGAMRRGYTDKNIDHRRVPNQMVFFGRHGETLPLGVTGSDLLTWHPGDIVCWRLKGGKWHTGVISDGMTPSGVPMVIHNGWICVEQDSLTAWPICAHYRYPKSAE